MMIDDDLAALCIWSEAQGEPFEGKVAVGRVIRNRMARCFQSDGTVVGTVLHPSAFSGFNHDFVDGHYMLVAHTAAQIAARAENMFEAARKTHMWSECVKAWSESAPDSGFAGGPQFQKLGDDVVSYYARTVCSAPPWATPATFVAQVFRHSFYREV